MDRHLVAPRDSEELTIWKKFVDKVGVDLVVIVRGEGEESVVKRIYVLMEDLLSGISLRSMKTKSNK